MKSKWLKATIKDPAFEIERGGCQLIKIYLISYFTTFFSNIYLFIHLLLYELFLSAFFHHPSKGGPFGSQSLEKKKKI